MAQDNNTISKRWFVAECALICILISGSLFFPLLNILSLGLCLFSIIKRRSEDNLCLMLLLLSFSPIFKIQLTGFALYNFLIITVVFKEILLTKGKLPIKVWGPIILLSLYSFFIGFNASITDLISFILSLMYGALVLNKKEYDIRRITDFTSLGIVASSFLGLVKDSIPNLNNYLKTARIKISGVSYYRFSGINGNPNYYTVLVGLVIAIYLVFIIKNKKKASDFVFVAVLSFFGLLSASNSFFLAYGVIGIVFLASLMKRHPKQLILVFVIVIVSIIVIVRNLDESTKTMLLYRLQNVMDEDATISSVTTSRTERWGLYIDYFISNPLKLIIGNGIGAENLENHATHNYYLEAFYYLGLIGSSLYFISIIRISKSYSVTARRHVFYEYLPIVYILIRGLARNLILSEQLIFFVVLCSACLHEDEFSDSYEPVLKDTVVLSDT